MSQLSGLHLRDVQGVSLACEQLGPADALLTLHVDNTELMLEFTSLTPQKLESIAALRGLPRSEDYMMFLGDARVPTWEADQRWLQWSHDQHKRQASRARPGLRAVQSERP